MRIPFVWVVFFILLYFIFFGNGRKKISVFKKSGYCGRGQKPHSNHTAAKKEYIGADPGGGAIMGWGGGGGWSMLIEI